MLKINDILRRRYFRYLGDAVSFFLSLLNARLLRTVKGIPFQIAGACQLIED